MNNKTELTPQINQTLLSHAIEQSSSGALAYNFNKMASTLTNEIIEHKKTAKSLKKSEEGYQKLIETAQDAIVSIDDNGIITIWNKFAERIFGYSDCEIKGQPVTTIIPERYRKYYEKELQRFLKTGEAGIIGGTTEVSGITKEGIEIPLEISLTFQKNEKNRYSFVAIIRDITDRKKQRDEIQKLLYAVEQSPVSVVITNTKGDIEYVNKKIYSGNRIFLRRSYRQKPKNTEIR